MKQLASSIIFILLVYACTSIDQWNSLDNIPTESVSIEWNRQTRLLDTAYYAVSKIVPLKLDSTMFIGHADKVEIYDGYIFLMDKEYAKRIFIFDSLGNMSAYIGGLGRAKNEYLRGPSDFSIDRKKREVCVMEAESNKLIRYDFNGKVKSTRRITDYWPYSFSCLSDGKYAFSFRMMDNNSNTDNCELIVSDTLFDIQERWRPLTTHQLFTKDFPFWNTDGHVFYIPNLSDTVLVFDADTIERKVHVDFKGHFLSPDDVCSLKKDGDYSILGDKEGVVNSICKYEENDYWLHIEYSTGVLFHYLKNRVTGKEYQGASLFDGMFPIQNICVDGKYLVCLVLGDDINILKQMISKDSREIQTLYEKSNDIIKGMINGKQSLPTLLYIDINREYDNIRK